MDIRTYKSGASGRITLTRPKALNALSHKMSLALEAALDEWRDDAEVKIVIIDAEGERAFCAGGDLQEMYDSGITGDYEPARTFWRDEYRMNAKIAEYPKPIVVFMQGFTMGGGVGIGGHASHRIVGETTQVAMPETGIGLVPDVGGTLLLAKAPGKLGEYLGLTGARMGAGDAIHAGFADYFVPQEYWLDLIATLEDTGDLDRLTATAGRAPESHLAAAQPEIDRLFQGDMAAILAACAAEESEIAASALKALGRASPISCAVTLANIARARASGDIRTVLGYEYEATSRAMEVGDFLEGVRAQIVDKDRSPTWKYAHGAVPEETIVQMTAPLGEAALTF